MTTETEVREALQYLLMDDDAVEDSGLPDVIAAHSYQDTGVLTYNEGLTIRLSDGSEFQITIVQSRTGTEA